MATDPTTLTIHRKTKLTLKSKMNRSNKSTLSKIKMLRWSWAALSLILMWTWPRKINQIHPNLPVSTRKLMSQKMHQSRSDKSSKTSNRRSRYNKMLQRRGTNSRSKLWGFSSRLPTDAQKWFVSIQTARRTHLPGKSSVKWRRSKKFCCMPPRWSQRKLTLRVFFAPNLNSFLLIMLNNSTTKN